MIGSATCEQNFSSVPLSAPKQAAKPRARFNGRHVVLDFADFWCEVHVCMSRPIGLIGAAVGGALGVVGSAVYKAGKYALGQEAQTKKLRDYAIESAQIGCKAFFWGTGVLLTPVIASAALVHGAISVAGAIVGALATPVLAPVYKMVKQSMGESVQNKSLSEYIIKSAEIGAYGFMFLGVFGLVSAVVNFAPPAALYSFVSWEVASCALRLNMHKLPAWVPM